MRTEKLLLFTTVTASLFLCVCISDPVQIKSSTVPLTVSVSLVSDCGLPQTRTLSIAFLDPDVNQQILSLSTLTFSAGTPSAEAIFNAPENSSVLRLFFPASGSMPQYIIHDEPVHLSPEAPVVSKVKIEGIRLVTFQFVQNRLFSKCIACHGGSAGDPAADLQLTGDPYTQLVNTQSSFSTLPRVTPHDTAASFLWHVVADDITPVDHSGAPSFSKPELEQLAEWILGGATR